MTESVSARQPPDSRDPGFLRCVSVVVPAHNEAAGISARIRAILAQAVSGIELQVIVVDDSSTDQTVPLARAAGAEVIRLPDSVAGGNPAAARNLGARVSRGDPIIFLDADCTPAPGWLEAFLAAHSRGEIVVGGSLDLPDGLSASARCDYYCGWYLVHSRRPAGYVPHHPPPNLSVRRDAFFSTSGYTEARPFSYTNEERRWQAELRRRGTRVYFEPRARVFHYNRPGFVNLLRRNYRWAYTSLAAKSTSGSARMAWMYRYPRLMIAASLPLAFAHTLYILGCWLRAGRLEPLLMVPFVFASRLAYAAGMAVGGVRWLRGSPETRSAAAPAW
jgi:glycosyltransferase involved in cell wall biosynthesis